MEDTGNSRQSKPAPHYRQTMSQNATEFDSPWKDVIERYFEDFIQFFLPQAHGYGVHTSSSKLLREGIVEEKGGGKPN